MEKGSNFKNIKKIGLGIVAFEGTEHLYNIISEIKDFIGYVVVGLQDISYHGDPIDPIDKEEVLRLKNEDHLVNTILNIKLNAKIAPREQETAKRNALIEDCQKHGCSHVLIIDSDEFYSKNAFERAVKVLKESDSSAAAIEGTELIYNKLFSFLKSRGLSVIEAMGKELDTEFHEAVAQFPTDDKEKKNKIIDIVQQGYMLNGKVVRYAKVVVGV